MNAGWLKSARDLAAKHERLIWIAVLGLVLMLQWPMLKGVYYRTAQTVPPPSSIEWRTDLEAALEEARQTGKPILVDFSAEWCPPCIAMKHDVWPHPEVERALTTSYVPLLIDVDTNGAVADRYGVRGIPTVLILDGQGRVVRQATFLTAPAMIDFLNKGLGSTGAGSD